MDKDFFFLIALHFHQPVDNFDFVIEKVCDSSYQPLLYTISDFPDIKFNLHYSGSLLEWFKKNRPEILLKIKELVKSGQVELLGGGFYEPILSVIRPEDSIGQIRMLSEFLKHEFGVEAKGAWLAERVWEAQLPEIFQKAGIGYTIVDDTHLGYAGLTQKDFYGYYITEYNQRRLNVFPADKYLRYAIPFKSQEKSIDYFRKIRERYGKGCVLYGDDGEKFGAWPKTFVPVYKEKWLYNFLRALRDNSSWLKTAKISDYIKLKKPNAKICLPGGSYEEMGEWSLPADSKGRRDPKYPGAWRDFFVKYPESNQLHKRASLTSERLSSLQKKKKFAVDKKLLEAKRELYRSQCNCAYWHGVYGGLYLYHLRSSLYKHLISADKIMDSIEHKKKGWVSIEKKDFNCDGKEEFILNTPRNTFIIDTAYGGTITEWSLKDKGVNILNTLSRKKEAYHKGSKGLCYDRYLRVLFLDHFLADNTKLEEFMHNKYKDKGNFAASPYSRPKIGLPKAPYIEIGKRGFIGPQLVSLRKRFILFPESDRLSIKYKIANLSSKPIKTNFAPELNFSLTQDDTKEELNSVGSLALADKVENFKIDLCFSQKAKKLFRFPVRTISQSEKDIEENYQASCILPVFDLIIDKNITKTITIDLQVSPCLSGKY